MKRLHLHISVDDLQTSKQFYSAIFGQEPTFEKPDYVRWEVDDPQVHLAISRQEARGFGIDHVGIKAETDDELKELDRRLAAIEAPVRDEPQAECCYAKSDKHWTKDPSGVVWEMFHTMDQVQVYGTDRGPEFAKDEAVQLRRSSGCC
ncbi:MAG: ArsI/CadI family heavy metal resistance metalloenzyme [Pseudomonadota bacterium]